MKKVKCGFIGCGWIVENAHLPAFSKLTEVELISVFDIDKSKAKRLAKLFNIKGIYNEINMFFYSGVEAVVIATPNHTHVYYTILALEKNIHVLCEKPVALCASDIKHIKNILKCKNLIYMPGYVNRFRNDILKMKKIITNDELGIITDVEAGWLRKNGVPRPGTWFTNKKYSGGGVLIDLGSHIIDICFMLTNYSKPSKIFLSTSKKTMSETVAADWFYKNYKSNNIIDVEDTAYLNVNYENNILMKVKLSWMAPIDGDITYFKIKGEKASLILKTLFGFSNNRLCKNDFLIKTSNYSGHIIEKYMINSNNQSDCFYNMAKYFIDKINNTSKKYISCNEALKSVSLIENLYAVEESNLKVDKFNLEDI